MKPPHSLAGKRILVVEDDDFIASQLVSDLEAAGAMVVGPASDVESALCHILQGPDLLGAILDIKLGHELVFPVADELDRLGVPFVFAAGYEADVVPARHADKIILKKPVEENSAILALSQLLSADPVTSRYAVRNGLLARLSEESLNALLPKLRTITVPRGAVLEVQY